MFLKWLLFVIPTVAGFNWTSTVEHLGDMLSQVFAPRILNSRILQTEHYLTDFDDCGELGGKDREENDETEAEGRQFLYRPVNLKQCMWDCKWKHNPYFKTSFPWLNLTEKNSKGKNINFLIDVTAPRVPKNLECLKDCFPQERQGTIYKKYDNYCRESFSCKDYLNFNSFKTFEFGTDIRLDCMLFRRSRKTEDKKIIGNWLNTNLDDTPPKVRKALNLNLKLEDQTFTRILRATNQIDLALEICLLAKSITKLNPKSQLFPNGNCDTLLPRICETKKFKKNKTKRKNKRKGRLFGPTTSKASNSSYPWVCSLKEQGFRGRHRCGVTLLSGPPKQTILVSAAHCNYVCKDRESKNMLEICCCRNATESGSCKNSPYCSGYPELVEANKNDLQIVCGEYNLEEKPHDYSDEDEIVLNIKRIIKHPNYEPGTNEDRRGPYTGYDIAVYQVDDTNLKLERRKLYPACLPKPQYESTKGIFAAWLDPEPYYRVNDERTLKTYRRNYQYLKQVQMEEVICRDPPWMQSNTYYPPGTVCYRDPSLASCVLFGNSGSGVIRKFANTGRYSWTGPLSMSKGCDLATSQNNTISYASQNAAVFTDASCFMDWIASQYGLKMPESYKKPDSCTLEKGNKNDIDQHFCKGLLIKKNETLKESFCDWTKKDNNSITWDKCRLFSQEGYAYNLHQCMDKDNNTLLCANNCKGVDPNAVVVGGTAVLAAAAIAGSSYLLPAVGLAGGVALGGPMALGMCPVFRCRANGKCCMLRLVRGRIRCPRRC